MSSLAGRRTRAHLRASRKRHPVAVVPAMHLHLLDGGAPGGQLSGAARHAIEAHGALTSAQRLSITVPTYLPREYTPVEADILVAALLVAGAHAAVVPAHHVQPADASLHQARSVDTVN